jgi:ribonuclease Z
MYHPEIIPAISGVDLLFHEATYMEKDLHRAIATGHSTAAQAAKIAAQAKAKRLVIGHFSSRYKDDCAIGQEAMKIFPQTTTANEGLILYI